MEEIILPGKIYSQNMLKSVSARQNCDYYGSTLNPDKEKIKVVQNLNYEMKSQNISHKVDVLFCSTSVF